MRGWLIASHFARDDEYLELLGDLEGAARRRGVDLARRTNVEVAPLLGRAEPIADPPDFVLFWCKDIQLARHLEARGLRLFNRVDAIELSDDKAATVAALERVGIRQPRTVMVPRSDVSTGWQQTGFVEATIEALGLPVVVKEVRGSFGREVYLARSHDELCRLLDGLSGHACICQEFISTSFGRDLRVQVVGNTVVGAIERHSETGDFRANISRGANYRAWDVTPEQDCVSREACLSLGLDFAGIDLMFGDHGQPIVCEVNANAHSFPEMRECCGIDVAGLIIDHIVRCVGEP